MASCLVVNQRNERADDDRQTVLNHRGQLVAQRLAAAGRHDHEDIALGERRVDDRALRRGAVYGGECWSVRSWRSSGM